MKYRLELVEWEDATGLDHGWHNKELCECEPLLVKSVGWVTAETKKAIRITSHYTSFQHHADMVIPKTAIKRRKRL